MRQVSKEEKKITRCGMCGVFMIDGRIMSADELNEFEASSLCPDCANEENERQNRTVTRDMAIDTGMPELEGMRI
jgi:hypothetical protein